MPKLSAVIITYNEERNIGRCLESIKKVADDIIVLDSFSTDKTEEICKKFKVDFIQREWTDYSDAKNYANQKARYDWILSIDADEALSDELKSSILELKEEEELSFCEFNRLTNYCGKWIKHSGWYPDRKLRIFDRRNADWVGKVHETLTIDNNVKINHIKGDMLHYSYYTISEHLERLNIFTDASSTELFKQGKKASVFKLIYKPKFKFLSTYILKLGFLDGYYGLVIAVLSAMSEFVKYSKLRSLNKYSE